MERGQRPGRRSMARRRPIFTYQMLLCNGGLTLDLVVGRCSNFSTASLGATKESVQQRQVSGQQMRFTVLDDEATKRVRCR